MSQNTKKSFILKLLNITEKIWEEKSGLICIILGVATGGLYYFNILGNIRFTISNMITFSSIVIGVNGVFLTLLITLQESPAFKRLKEIFPSFQISLFTSLKTQIQYGLIVVMLSIFISMLPNSPSIILSAIGISIYFSFFWLMTLGSFYSVKLVTDIIVKNFKIPKRNSRS